jgi:hypothetical protein
MKKTILSVGLLVIAINMHLGASSSSKSEVRETPPMRFYGYFPQPKKGTAYAQYRKSVRSVGLRAKPYATVDQGQDQGFGRIDPAIRLARLMTYHTLYWRKVCYYGELLAKGDRYFTEERKEVLRNLIASSVQRYNQKGVAIEKLNHLYAHEKREEKELCVLRAKQKCHSFDPRTI